ncbi:MAG: DUF3786 domain-containing protein [Desulfobacterales bacterium]|nr:DUF3786 domain-containing protein [Desulfobacterales bacterium]
MSTNYEKIIRENLSGFYAQLPREDVETCLASESKGDGLGFRAFGEDCRIGPDAITLSGQTVVDPKGLLISLYAVHAGPYQVQIEPLKAFKDFPGSMPYQGAFSANSERVLVPHVLSIREKQENIKTIFDGLDGPPGVSGDFSFILFPLPKIALCYIFYLPDDEFPASATCLFSANALSFMPLDGLADVAEYTSRKIIEYLLAEQE